MLVTYNPILVLASSMIAVLAAYITLEVANRLNLSAGETNQTFWLVGGAITLGSGIWSMHFIAILAFSIPVAITYNLLLVLISLLAPVLVSFQALSIISRPQPTLATLLLGSLIVGTGIVIMHYSGMAAMQMSATLRYNLLLVALSVAIAIAVSFAALTLALLFRKSQEQKFLKGISALIMGVAVMSMHYTGMAAAAFEPNPDKIVPLSGLDNNSLAVLVCFYIVFVMGIVLAALYFEPKRGI